MSEHVHDWKPAEAPHYECACGATGRKVLPRYRGDKGMKLRPVGMIAPINAATRERMYQSIAKRYVDRHEGRGEPEYVHQTTERIDEVARGTRKP